VLSVVWVFNIESHSPVQKVRGISVRCLSPEITPLLPGFIWDVHQLVVGVIWSVIIRV